LKASHGPLTRTAVLAVSRAADQSSTHIWAAEALDLLALAYGSITTAERVLLRELKADRIPWTYMDVDPPGSNVERMWQQLQYTLKPQLAQNQATFLAVGTSTGGMDLETIKVGGIKFELAAIMALLPADAAAPEAGDGPSDAVDSVSEAIEAGVNAVKSADPSTVGETVPKKVGRPSYEKEAIKAVATQLVSDQQKRPEGVSTEFRTFVEQVAAACNENDIITPDLDETKRISGTWRRLLKQIHDDARGATPRQN
jgi:hypothetical protein